MGREGGVVRRLKPKETAHSREGAMGHAALPGRWPRKKNGSARQPRPTRPESKECLKSDFIFKFKWFFGI
jgi:hypothetical protein